MMWIKLKRDGALGKKNAVVQCVEYIAKQRIKDGLAIECDEPKRGKRTKVENKALSA